MRQITTQVDSDVMPQCPFCYKKYNNIGVKNRHVNQCVKNPDRSRNPQIPWNKGLTIETDSRVAAGAEKVSIALLGHIPWNKGLTSDTDDRILFGPDNGMYGKTGKDHPMFGVKRPGIKSAFWGKHHSDETKRKMREARTGNKNCHYGKRGLDAPAWKPELSEEYRVKHRTSQELYEWRKAIYKRDNYTCQACGTRHCKFNAHHLFDYKSYPKLRAELYNGITLCSSCHIDFHNFLGNNRISCTAIDFLVWLECREQKSASIEVSQ